MDLGASGPVVETNWFKNEEDTSDGELAPDMRHLALELPHGDRLKLSIVEVGGDPRTAGPAKPSVIDCGFGPDARLAGPTWSPDGTGLAFTSKDGIQIARFTRIAAGDCEIANHTTVDFAAGWSRSPVSPRPRRPAPPR